MGQLRQGNTGGRTMMNDRNDIVVVDDSPALLSVLSEIFKEHGYTVRKAADGFEALAVIRDREPDILVSDLNMPGMSGFELLSVVAPSISRDRRHSDERDVFRCNSLSGSCGRRVLRERLNQYWR